VYIDGLLGHYVVTRIHSKVSRLEQHDLSQRIGREFLQNSQQNAVDFEHIARQFAKRTNPSRIDRL